MAYISTKTLVVAVAVLAVALTAIFPAKAQDIPACASGLVSCADYLNATTKPPAKCCDPLKDAVNKQLKCLCNLYNTPGLLKSFGINVADAVRLPSLCGVPGGANLCQGGGKNSTSPTSPATSAPPSKENDSSPKSNAGRLSSAGTFSGLLILASLMLH